MSKIDLNNLKIGEYYYVPNKQNPDAITLIRNRSNVVDEEREKIYGDVLSNMDTPDMEYSHKIWITGIPKRICTPEERAQLDAAIKADFEKREKLRIAVTEANKSNAKLNKQ